MKKLLLGLFVVALIAADINYSLAHAEVTPESQENDGSRYSSVDTGWADFINLDQEPLPVWVLIAQSEGEK